MTIRADAATSLPPHFRYRLDEVLGLLPAQGKEPTDEALTRLDRFLTEAQPWLAAQPELIDVGLELLDRSQVPQLREHGAHWLTHFPTLRTVEALGAVLREAEAPLSVREQAVWTLGFRQRRDAHVSLRWTDEVIAAADAVLAEAIDRDVAAQKVTLEQLPLTARSCRSEVVFRALQKAPVLFGDALEAWADAPLAHALLDQLELVSPRHKLRALRLIAATLGADAIPALQEKAAGGEFDDRLETLFLSVSFGDTDARATFEKLISELKFGKQLAERMAWHEANPGVVPTVRGLQVARVTATRAPEELASACGQAADDLGALTRFARHPEAYLYTMWGWMVRGSGDPARARALVGAYPEAEGLVRRLHFEDLAQRGRVKQVQAAAQGAAGGEHAALALAIHGRPLAALELAGTTRRHTPAVVVARILGCYRGGRADLAERVLAEDLPPSELVPGAELPPFPGPHERWMADNAPAADPALTALVRGRDAVLALAKASPAGAEDVSSSLEPLAQVVKRLGRGLPGSTVYFAGEFKKLNKDALRAAVVKAGAREVHGPFPDTDYYLMGDWCEVTTIAQLERQGTRRLRRGEVEGL